MCGRYTLTVPGETVAEVFELPSIPELAPRYNIAPTQDAPVIRVVSDPLEEAAEAAAGRTVAGERRCDALRWGLVPFWADDPGIGNRLINARAETAHEKPAFRDSFGKRRCLVVCDGFYEWKKEEGGKQPYWIHRPDGRPFAFAGLWSRWDGGKKGELPAGQPPLETFTILTCPALPELREVHHRMPVILAREDQDAWLDPAMDDRDALVSMLRRPVGKGLDLRRVSRRVNSPANDTPDVLREMTD